MSIRLMTQLWDNADPELSGSRLVIMLCLADHANDDGECWPSIERLAKRARLHRQNVMVHLKELEAAGYISVKRIEGRHNSYVVYPTSNGIVTGNETVTRNASVTPTRNEGVTGTSNGIVTPPVTPALPEPSVNHQSLNRQIKRKGEPPPPPPAYASATSGRDLATKLTKLNQTLAPELRTPLADALLDVTGKRALADSGSTEGDRLRMAAHEAADVLYRMGVKSESDILALEPAWNEDWRGVSGGTAKQFLEFVSEQQAGKIGKRAGSNGHNKGAVVPTTAEERKRMYATEED